MISLFCKVVLGACALATPDDSMAGYLSYYTPQPSIATREYRQSVGDIPSDLSRYAGLIAVADCSKIGKEAWLEVNGRWLPVLVFDCAGNDGTTYWMQTNRIVAEVDHGLASMIDFDSGPVPSKLAWNEQESP